MRWRVSGGACGGAELVTTFGHLAADDALTFRQTYPTGVADTAGAPQPACPACTLNSSSVPLSEFPAFRSAPGTALHDRLGWYQWGGTFGRSRAAGGVGLRRARLAKEEQGLAGGQEAGPLLLFEDGRPQGAALVLSPMDS